VSINLILDNVVVANDDDDDDGAAGGRTAHLHRACLSTCSGECRSSCEVHEQKLTLIITVQLGNSLETMYEREGDTERKRERERTYCREQRQKSSLLAGGHDFLVSKVDRVDEV
jgi:hypothetical protein